jgi:hypothetical protein
MLPYFLFFPLSASAPPPWRTTLEGQCWTNTSCQRALIVSHGGAWSLEKPYDSLPAVRQAFDDGSDAVKGDFRVSADGVGVVCHSSPLKWYAARTHACALANAHARRYESPQCAGLVVENSTAAAIMRCPMALTADTFMTVPSFLSYTQGKMITMLCVKRTSDIARAVSTLVESNATQRAFLEIGLGALLSIVPTVPDWEQVYYLVEGDSMADIHSLVNTSTALRARAFAFEFNGHAKGQWSGVNLTLAFEMLHAAGIRAFVATTEITPSIAGQEALWGEGFDIVYTYDTVNAVAARTAVDVARGVAPP